MKVKPFGLSRDEQRRELDRIRHPFRIVVDRAKNPFNIGTIIRTAHSFLAAEIVLLGTERWYERAAMGMQRYEHVTEIPTVEAFLARARAERWRLTVFERERATTDLWRAELPEDAVLVFGNEDDGVAPAIVEAAAEVVAIPMYGINHSYPVVVAAGIAMAEWARRRYERGRIVVPRAAGPRAETRGAEAETAQRDANPPGEPGAGPRRRP
ncbi:MAG: RNA methyltransferase [Myxococcales bacterium]|nr:RNA methyltransferase [Myxococcales bacterium]